jgi:CBS domain-containing protein
MIRDTIRAAAERARAEARRGMAESRRRLDDARERREHNRLLWELGEAFYAEHSGEATHEAVARRLAALDARKTSSRSEPDPAQANRQARDIMHQGAECIPADSTVAAAAAKMRELGVGSLPICGADDRLHGILTDRDIVIKCIAEGRDPAQTRAADLAQGTVFWVEASADIGEVLHQMQDHQVRRLPVIDNHRLVGIISEADLARNLDEHRLAEFVEKVYATS